MQISNKQQQKVEKFWDNFLSLFQEIYEKGHLLAGEFGMDILGLKFSTNEELETEAWLIIDLDRKINNKELWLEESAKMLKHYLTDLFQAWLELRKAIGLSLKACEVVFDKEPVSLKFYFSEGVYFFEAKPKTKAGNSGFPDSPRALRAKLAELLETTQGEVINLLSEYVPLMRGIASNVEEERYERVKKKCGQDLKTLVEILEYRRSKKKNFSEDDIKIDFRDM